MRSLFSTINEPSVIKALGFTGAAAALNLVSVGLGILATSLAIAYTIYRWRRDVLERSCDVSNCPHRHRPE